MPAVPAKPWTWGPLSLLLAGPLLAGVLDFRIPFALTFTLSPTRMVAAVAVVVCGAEVLGRAPQGAEGGKGWMCAAF